MLTHIYIDMDGVLADFHSAALRLHGMTYDPATYPKNEWEIANILGISQDDFWAPINAQGIDYWANLEPLPWAFDLLRFCEGAAATLGAKLRTATKPSKSHACAAGKVIWLQKHAPDLRYILIKDKEELATPNRVLIDDSSANIQTFHGAGGQTILIPHPWNGNDNPPDMLEHVRLSLSSIIGQELTRDGSYAA